MKAPLTWPNISLSSSSRLRLGQLTVTNGPVDRLLQPWIRRARTPLPVPLSPLIRTTASVAATRRAWSRIVASCGSGLSSDDLGHLRSHLILQVSHAVMQSANPSHPLEDRAHLGRRERLGQEVERPRRMASTARSMVP